MGNWYCKNCSSWKDSWAEHQSYKPTETYRRDIRCYSCDEWSLIYTDSQEKEYKALVKEKTSIPGYIEEVERFSTWWSNNIATVIAGHNGYSRVFLLVYDPAYSSSRPAVFPENYNLDHWGDSGRDRENHCCFEDAQIEARWLRDEFN